MARKKLQSPSKPAATDELLPGEFYCISGKWYYLIDRADSLSHDLNWPENISINIMSRAKELGIDSLDIIESASDAALLKRFDEAIDRLGSVARDACALVERNSEDLAFIKAKNDSIERMIAVNQAALDLLVGLQPA